MTNLAPIDPEWSFATSDEYLVTECACRTCECYEPAEEQSDVCLGCQHNAHPGEVE